MYKVCVHVPDISTGGASRVYLTTGERDGSLIALIRAEQWCGGADIGSN